jgi:hypothetical protein
MAAFKLGVHVRPQHTSVQALRDAWKAAEWCAKVGRGPRQIERTTNIPTSAIDRTRVRRGGRAAAAAAA